MNRTQHITNSVNDRLSQLEEYTVLKVWEIAKFNEYQFPYVHARILGEQARSAADYEDDSNSSDLVDLRVEIIVGYSIDRDEDQEGLFAAEEAERIHEVRQWLDNYGYTVEDYQDRGEWVNFHPFNYSGYQGITMDATETKGVSVLALTLPFQVVKI